jgi:hypothetical protein
MMNPTRRNPSSALALAHGAYLTLIGAWPLLHLGSFAKVTGPKPEGWLTKAVGACLANVGVELLRRRPVDSSARAMAFRTAAIFAGFDFYYAGYRRRISPVYLLNGAAQLVFAGLWLAQIQAENAARVPSHPDRTPSHRADLAAQQVSG